MPRENEEKMDLLRREEIRTMEKDMKRVREREADNRRGQMATILPKEEMAPEIKGDQEVEMALRQLRERGRKMRKSAPAQKEAPAFRIIPEQKASESSKRPLAGDRRLEQPFLQKEKAAKEVEMKRAEALAQERAVQEKRKMEEERGKQEAVREERLAQERRMAEIKRKEQAKEEEKRKAEEERLTEMKKREELQKEEARKKEEVLAMERAVQERRRAEEEQMRKDEESRKNGEEARKKTEAERARKTAELSVVPEEIRRLQEKRASLERNLQNLPSERAPLIEEKNAFLAQTDKARENMLRPVLREEDQVEREKKVVEDKEKGAATLAEKRLVEEERWSVEQKRKEVERKRWQVEDQISRLNQNLKDVDERLDELTKKEDHIKREIEETAKRIKGLELKKEWVKIKDLLEARREERAKIETLLREIGNRKSEVEKNLKEVLVSEKALEEEIEILEKKEAIATPTEKRELEKRRWKISDERRKTEEEKWRYQSEEKTLLEGIKDNEARFQESKNKENELADRFKELDDFLREAGIKLEETVAERPGVSFVVQEPPEEKYPGASEETYEREEFFRRISLEQQPPADTEAEAARKEKYFPERGQPAEEEPFRSAKINRQDILKKVFEDEEPVPGAMEIKKEDIDKMQQEGFQKIQINIPKPPPSPVKKFLIRFLIIAAILALLGTIIWLMLPKDLFKKSPAPVVQKNGSQEVKKNEIPLPFSLIPVEKTFILEVENRNSIPGEFDRAMSDQEVSPDFFGRLLFKNRNENRFFSLDEISEAFKIEIPQEVTQSLGSDFTLAIFSQKEGKRTALVTKVRDPTALNAALKNWESEITREGLFFSGIKVPTSATYFKTAFFDEVAFRYLTVSKDDLALSYAAFDDYFVLTNSFTSIKKIISGLKTQSNLNLEEKVGQMLIVGFDGKTVTPQLEDFFRKYKPGGILLFPKNIESAGQLKTLISGLQAVSIRETGLSLFVAVDQEGIPRNVVDFLAEKTAQSQIKNIQQAQTVGRNRGQQLKELGINLNLAPVLDDMKSGDFYYDRAFKKPPQEAGELAKYLILGQKEAGILTAMKHFPGYVGMPDDPKIKLGETSLPEISQFQKAAEANPEFIMAANAIYKEIDPYFPFSFSEKGINYLLDNVKTESLIITDDLAQAPLSERFPLKEMFKMPIAAGSDILIFSGFKIQVEEGLKAFMEAVQNKEIPEGKINETIAKIIWLKKEVLK